MPYGVRLNLGGAPATPHRVIDPTPGATGALIVLTPGEIVSLDEKGIPLEAARKWAKDPGNPLELVEIDKDGKEVDHTKAAGQKATPVDTEKGKD